jgi:hypothetical protein
VRHVEAHGLEATAHVEVADAGRHRGSADRVEMAPQQRRRANVACWGLVLFTFYGVNFFLVGLHSYAGEAAAVKLPPLLIVYLVFELIVVGVGIWYTKSGRLRTRQAAAS